jgi:divalent metal cation (Fe/Co/Zn/Cd) transporter
MLSVKGAPGVAHELTRLMLLSVAAAVATIALKASAWLLTGSVEFLSDAAESIANLVGALVALIAVRVAARSPDDDHAYGYEKAEYLSAGAEGTLMLVAAASIAWVAVGRLVAYTRAGFLSIAITR